MLKRLLGRLVSAHGDDQAGVALVAAMMVAVVAMTLSGVALDLAVHTVNGSALQRRQVQSVDAAEAGLNATYAVLQTTQLSSLPCTPISGVLSTAPAPVSYSVSIAYYAAFPPSGPPMTCPLDANPAAAELTSTATVDPNLYGARRMQALVQMSPWGAFDSAIYSNCSLSFGGNPTIYGHSGNDANIYTNGYVNLPDHTTVYGSIYSQANPPTGCSGGGGDGGSGVSLGQNSSILQDVWSVGPVSLSNHASVGHDVTSSQNSISMSGNSQIGHDATTATTCSGCVSGSGGNVGGQVVQSAPSPPPPSQPMPQLNYDQAAWLTAGYTINSYSDCTVAAIALAALASQVTPQLADITGGCSLNLTGQLSLSTNLAIFSDGPITMSHNFSVSSADGAPHQIYLIVPYSDASSCSSDGAPNIQASEHVSFGSPTSPISAFIYTPCTANFSENVTGTGQVYAGTVKASEHFTLTYSPASSIPGAPLGGGVGAFHVGISYEREVPA